MWAPNSGARRKSWLCWSLQEKSNGERHHKVLSGVMSVRTKLWLVAVYLKISKIEKNVSLDHTRNCISTSNKHKKIHVRINSTVKVIRACIFIMWSVLEGTQRVPPTCTRLHVPTLLAFATAVFEPAVVNAFHIDPAITVVTPPSCHWTHRTHWTYH